MTADAKRMTLKKSQSQQNDKPLLGKSTDLLGEIKSEFKKISWTEPDALKTYTKVVVGATFVVGLGIYFVDLAIQMGLTLMELVVKGIFG